MPGERQPPFNPGFCIRTITSYPAVFVSFTVCSAIDRRRVVSSVSHPSAVSCLSVGVSGHVFLGWYCHVMALEE